MEIRDEVRKFFNLLPNYMLYTTCLEFVLSLIIHLVLLVFPNYIRKCQPVSQLPEILTSYELVLF